MGDEPFCDNDLHPEDSQVSLPITPPEKVLSPFLKVLKKRRRIKADEVLEEYKEFYIRQNPQELLAKLQISFEDSLKLVTIMNETAELLRVVTSSKSVNLYLTDYEQNVITLCPKVLNKNDRFHVKYQIEPEKTLAAYVAYKKEYVIVGDILGDPRFPDGIPGTGKTAKAAICIPVMCNISGNCIAVIELYRDFQQPVYDTVNLQICTALCGWVGIGVEENSSKLKLVEDVEIRKYLLSISQLYHEKILTFDKAISDIIVFSKTSVNADKCTFYLFDKPVEFGSEDVIHAEVYQEALVESRGPAVFRKKRKASFEKGQRGIAGYVARSAESILIKDAYKDDRYEITLDPPDYRTRSLLATPIKSVRGVLGVLKMANKLTFTSFTANDVSLMELFAKYATLLCEHEELRKITEKQAHEMEVMRELLFIHTKPNDEELDSFKAQPVLNMQQIPHGFFRFDWNLLFYEDEIPKYILFVFLGSELFEPYMFDNANVISFALSVKKGYRRVPFHNIEHAFTVFHFLFNVLYRNRERFSLNELVSLMIAGICHELDHRGVTNSFVELKNYPIAQLYDEYPQEEHHYNVCRLLIQTNDLLSKFNQEDCEDIMNEIHQLILSVNLSFFFRAKRELVKLVNENLFDWENPQHRFMLKICLMVCGEYSYNFRPFDVIRKTVDNFYRELYNQGDEEKSMGLTPVSMMDRNQSSFIPENHLSLLVTVVEPCAEIVCELLPNCHEIESLCKDGAEKWKELITLRGVEVWKPEESLLKEKKFRSNRTTVLSALSSVKSVQSIQRSGKFED